MNNNYYQMLRVAPNASAAAIRSAFRKLAKTCHPDMHPNDAQAAQRFIALNQAYEVLSDAHARRNYDAAQSVAGDTFPSPRQPTQEDIERFYRRMHEASSESLSLRENITLVLLLVLQSPVTYCVLFVFLMLVCLKAGIDNATHVMLPR